MPVVEPAVPSLSAGNSGEGTPSQPAASAASAAAQLREETAAVRLRIRRFGTRRSLDPADQVRAASTFGAEHDYLSARKKLLDTKHVAFRQVTRQIGLARTLWRQMTLPFPEPSIRLIRRQRIDEFEAALSGIRSDLSEALHALDEVYAVLRADARDRLGELYDADDYPDCLSEEFGFAWDFPSVEPPNYLAELSPALYEQEQQRVQARFDEAVRLAEDAFTTELTELVQRLSDRLSGDEDGKPKVLRESAVVNLREFFDRFSQLNIRSNAALDGLVEQARQAIEGVDVADLRNRDDLRQQVGERLGEVRTQLEQLTVEQPPRQFFFDDTPGDAEAGDTGGEDA